MSESEVPIACLYIQLAVAVPCPFELPPQTLLWRNFLGLFRRPQASLSLSLSSSNPTYFSSTDSLPLTSSYSNTLIVYYVPVSYTHLTLPTKA